METATQNHDLPLAFGILIGAACLVGALYLANEKPEIKSASRPAAEYIKDLHPDWNNAPTLKK
jgi:hypothetical protein